MSRHLGKALVKVTVVLALIACSTALLLPTGASAAPSRDVVGTVAPTEVAGSQPVQERARDNDTVRVRPSVLTAPKSSDWYAFDIYPSEDSCRFVGSHFLGIYWYAYWCWDFTGLGVDWILYVKYYNV